MRFVHPMWMFGSLVALVVAVLFIAGGFAWVRSVKRFGDIALVETLLTARSGRRRTLKGVLVVFATALMFVALAQPQYGKGTQLVPATNLDIVLVLDFSKSMYAQDVAPSRIERAKAEVAHLVKRLRGARFAAVAFAGDPIGFPLTNDGAAIAQFFRQLDPNDMPVGGTAIGRALHRANELLSRDPKAEKHHRVIVLITDGEDLEGDPIAVAQAIAQNHTTLHVVQIGGRTPERIPEVDTTGKVIGYMRDSEGKELTTELTTHGEEQLIAVAQAGGGDIIRASKGTTGIEELANRMQRLMQSELSERVETVYNDVYYYPLGLALLLLVAEALVGASRRKTQRAVRGIGSVGHAQ